MKNRNLEHSDDWATPKELFQALNKEFNFDFDPCPLRSEFDGLSIGWGKSNFVNPPYSRKLKEAFIRKAYQESLSGKLCVMLLPVSTSTKIFHEVIYPNAEIRFLPKRVSFSGINEKGQFVNYPEDICTNELIQFNGELIPKYIKNSGQHDSMIVIFKPKNKGE